MKRLIVILALLFASPVMAAEYTVGDGGSECNPCSYASLNLAEDALDGAMSEDITITGYNFTDTTNVSFAGWTENDTYTLTVQGAYPATDAKAYHLSGSLNSAAMFGTQEAMVIRDIRISGTGTAGTNSVLALLPFTNPVIVDGCWIAMNWAEATTGKPIYCGSGDVDIIRNCIIETADVDGTAVSITAPAAGSLFQNNTIYGGDKCAEYSDNLLIQNNICVVTNPSANSDSGWSGANHASNDYNTTSVNEATVTGGAHDKYNVTPTFVNAPSDLHLAAGDTVAKNSGMDLSGTFTDDVDGDTRTVPWCIGADEFLPLGGFGPQIITY